MDEDCATGAIPAVDAQRRVYQEQQQQQMGQHMEEWHDELQMPSPTRQQAGSLADNSSSTEGTDSAFDTSECATLDGHIQILQLLHHMHKERQDQLVAQQRQQRADNLSALQDLWRQQAIDQHALAKMQEREEDRLDALVASYAKQSRNLRKPPKLRKTVRAQASATLLSQYAPLRSEKGRSALRTTEQREQDAAQERNRYEARLLAREAELLEQLRRRAPQQQRHQDARNVQQRNTSASEQPSDLPMLQASANIITPSTSRSPRQSGIPARTFQPTGRPAQAGTSAGAMRASPANTPAPLDALAASSVASSSFMQWPQNDFDSSTPYEPSSTEAISEAQHEPSVQHGHAAAGVNAGASSSRSSISQATVPESLSSRAATSVPAELSSSSPPASAPRSSATVGDTRTPRDSHSTKPAPLPSSSTLRLHASQVHKRNPLANKPLAGRSNSSPPRASIVSQNAASPIENTDLNDASHAGKRRIEADTGLTSTESKRCRIETSANKPASARISAELLANASASTCAVDGVAGRQSLSLTVPPVVRTPRDSVTKQSAPSTSSTPASASSSSTSRNSATPLPLPRPYVPRPVTRLEQLQHDAFRKPSNADPASNELSSGPEASPVASSARLTDICAISDEDAALAESPIDNEGAVNVAAPEGVPQPEVPPDDDCIASTTKKRYTLADLEALRCRTLAALPGPVADLLGTFRNPTSPPLTYAAGAVVSTFAETIVSREISDMAQAAQLPDISYLATRSFESTDCLMWAYLLPIAKAENLPVLFLLQALPAHFGQVMIESNWATLQDCQTAGVKAEMADLVTPNGSVQGERVSAQFFGKTPSTTTTAMKKSGLSLSSTIVTRDRQPLVWSNKLTGKAPLRTSSERLHRAYLLVEAISLLVWLKLGGGMSLVLSCETLRDLQKAVQMLESARLVKMESSSLSESMEGVVRWTVVYLSNDASKWVLLWHGYAPSLRWYLEASRWLHLSADLTILTFRLIIGGPSPLFDEYHASLLCPAQLGPEGITRSLPPWLYETHLRATLALGDEKSPADTEPDDSLHRLISHRYQTNESDIKKLCKDLFSLGWKNIFSIYSVYLARRGHRTYNLYITLGRFLSTHYVGQELPPQSTIKSLHPEVGLALEQVLETPIFKLQYLPLLAPKPELRMKAVAAVMSATSPQQIARKRWLEATFRKIFAEWATLERIEDGQLERDNPIAYQGLLELEQVLVHKLGWPASSDKERLARLERFDAKASSHRAAQRKYNQSERGKSTTAARIQRERDDPDVWCRSCNTRESNGGFRTGPYGENGAPLAKSLCKTCYTRMLPLKKATAGEGEQQAAAQ